MTSKVWKVEEGEWGRLAWLLTALSKKGTAAETTGQGADAGRTPSTEPCETEWQPRKRGAEGEEGGRR